MNGEYGGEVYEALAAASTPEEVRAALQRCGCRLTAESKLKNPRKDEGGEEDFGYPEEAGVEDDAHGAPSKRRGGVLTIVIDKMGKDRAKKSMEEDEDDGY